MQQRYAAAIIVVRLNRSELALLKARAAADGDTLSGCIREALYAYGIDPFIAPSSSAHPARGVTSG